MGFESFNSSSDRRLVSRHPWPLCKNSHRQLFQQLNLMQVQNWQGEQWKFVACNEMMNPRQVPNLLFTATLLTCVYTFI